ncbi:MAG: hypothetical protein GXP25_22400 [Planctomycetes bacterium]|nr:hypothetical protein [Planctomycetota bacterium]
MEELEPRTAPSVLPGAVDIDGQFVPVAGNAEGCTIQGSGPDDFTTQFRADFESGADGFIANNYNSGLWHRSNGHGQEAGHSQEWSFYYGRGETAQGGGSIDAGVANAGTLVAPEISLPDSAFIYMDFKYLLDTEPYTAQKFDIAKLQISDGAGWTDLARYDHVADSDEWVTADPVDLSAYAGRNVDIRFFFETVDARYNWFEGWYVDDVHVYAPKPDHYAFTLDAAETATISVTSDGGNGDVALDLFNSAGVLVASGIDLDTDASETISDYRALWSGKYTLRVSAKPGVAYTLNIDRTDAPTATPAVLNSHNKVYKFQDADGDRMQVIYVGKGTVTLSDLHGNAPMGTDIGMMLLSNTTVNDKLIVKCVGGRNGGRTMHIGDTLGDGSIGQLLLIAPKGTIENSSVGIKGDVNMVKIIADTADIDLQVGGNVDKMFFIATAEGSNVTIGGDLSLFKSVREINGSQFRIMGDASQMMFVRHVDGLMLDIDGTAERVKATREIHHSRITIGDLVSWQSKAVKFSSIAVENSLESLYLLGNLFDSRITSTCDAESISIFGNVASSIPGHIAVSVRGGHDVQEFIADGGAINAGFAFTGNVGTAMIGTVSTQMTLTIQGNLGDGFIEGRTTDSRVDIAGDVGFLNVGKDVDHSTVHIGGNAGQVGIGGSMVESQLSVDGRVDEMMLQKRRDRYSVDANSTVTLGSLGIKLTTTGDVRGTVNIIGSAAGAGIRVGGDLDGSLLASAFGDVTVSGRFSGTIGREGTEAQGEGRLTIGQNAGGQVVPGSSIFTEIVGL